MRGGRGRGQPRTQVALPFSTHPLGPEDRDQGQGHAVGLVALREETRALSSSPSHRNLTLPDLDLDSQPLEP